MSRAALITGATGAIGPLLLTELVRTREFDRIFVVCRSAASRGPSKDVTIVTGDVRLPDLGLDDVAVSDITREVGVIVHAAANTRFTAPPAELHADNVLGTRQILALAAKCPRLQQLLLVSTTCVSGARTGVIAERVAAGASDFVNPYEHTKWLAEQAAIAAGIPLRIARLSTCLGDAETGFVPRPGAIHHALRWFASGLIPVLPGTMETRLDLISTNAAARWLARACTRPVDTLDICHVAAGDRAVRLHDLLTFVVDFVQKRDCHGRRVRIEQPLVVDEATFAVFERMVLQSGDARFRRVLESMRSFLPALRFPRVYETSRAEACWGGPLPLGDWRLALGNVAHFVLARHCHPDRVERGAYA